MNVNRNAIFFLIATICMVVKAKKKMKEEPIRIRDPFLVQIDIDDGRGIGLEPRTDTMTCTGIIIKPKVVLSACHCFTDDGKTFYETWRVEIVAGTGNSWDPPPLTQKITARKIVPHPKCKKSGNFRWEYDVAFAILHSHLDYNENVYQIDIAPKVSDLKAMTNDIAMCRIHSLEPGVKDHPEERPKKLVVTNVTLMGDDLCHRYMCGLTEENNYLCKKQWWKTGYVCVYDVGCLGHSGGALVCNGLLYGIDTFDLCKPKNYPKPVTNLAVIKSLWKAFWAVGENRAFSAWNLPKKKPVRGG